VAWVGLAVATGIGLRFIELPDFALPVMVGLAVTAGVTLILHLLLMSGSSEPAPAAAVAPATPRRSGVHKKLTPTRPRRDT
jgi:hypothetical protein